jgi:outer membrane protein OmpA-like peptidoglycan-associated protein
MTQRSTAILALALAAALGGLQPVAAQQAPAGAGVTAEDLIEALQPCAAPQDPTQCTRGIRLMNVPVAKGTAPTYAPAGGSTAPGRPAVALDVRFERNSAELTPEAREVVKALAAAMKSDALAAQRFLVEGHTDSTGPRKYNIELSERRAEAVRAQLTQLGVSGTRLETAGHGPDQPLDAEHPENGVNRRVQVINAGPR